MIEPDATGASVFLADRVAAVRILLLSTDAIAPAPSGSGNRAIRWGLIDGLRGACAIPAFYSAASAGRHAEEFLTAQDTLNLGSNRFWFNRPTEGDAAIRALKDAVDQFKPDIILTYGIDPMKLARRTVPKVPAGIMSVDLEHLPVLHRHWHNLRYGGVRQKIKSLLSTPRQLFLSWRIRREIIHGYPLADCVINHAAHHANWHAIKHGVPVLYTPNPVSPLPTLPRRSMAKKPRFLLLGGIGGIATLSGLAWFANEVYAHLEASISRGDFEVHLIGRGELEDAISKRMPKVIRRGFVEDLTSEFEGAAALLVPTPITLGFRTRILDAFRHGVTVVAHQANGVGMPELRQGQNALVARTGLDFANAVIQLGTDPSKVEQLGAIALENFSRDLNSISAAEKVVSFVKKVLALRSNCQDAAI